MTQRRAETFVLNFSAMKCSLLRLKRIVHLAKTQGVQDDWEIEINDDGSRFSAMSGFVIAEAVEPAPVVPVDPPPVD